MRKSLYVFLLPVLGILCAGCAKPQPRLSIEEEYRIRQERRRQESRKKREDRITSLSGLNSVELDELEKSKRENDLNPKPGAFVYSPRQENLHGTGNLMKELNDDGQKKVQQYRDSVKQKNKSGRGWVYGM